MKLIQVSKKDAHRKVMDWEPAILISVHCAHALEDDKLTV